MAARLKEKRKFLRRLQRTQESSAGKLRWGDSIWEGYVMLIRVSFSTARTSTFQVHMRTVLIHPLAINVAIRHRQVHWIAQPPANGDEEYRERSTRSHLASEKPVNKIVTRIKEIVVSDGVRLILDSDTPWMHQNSDHADEVKESPVPIVFFGMELVVVPRITGVPATAFVQASKVAKHFGAFKPSEPGKSAAHARFTAAISWRANSSGEQPIKF